MNYVSCSNRISPGARTKNGFYTKGKEHPRATACIARVRCGAPATTGTVGRRRFIRAVVMPIACTSTTVGSLRITVTTVHTVVSCVASRNRGALGTPTEPDGQGAARDGGDSRDPTGRNFPTGQQKNYSAPRSLSARLGDSFYFVISKIVESLLRRGARTHRVFYWPAGGKLHCPRAGGNGSNNSRCSIHFLLQQSRAVELSRRAGTALTPGGRCLPALGTGHSGEKTSSVRAPWRFILFRQVRNS